MTIYLVRHCTSVEQSMVRGRMKGYPLSPEGRKQARKLVKFFANKDIKAVYSSPMMRTVQTARTIARSKGLGVRKAKQINEFYAPRWQGKYLGRITGEKGIGLKDTLLYALKPTLLDLGGESFEQAGRRLANFCRKAGDGTVLVSHRDVILSGKLVLMGRSVDLLNFCRCMTGSVTMLERKDGKWRQAGYFEP